jgi:hypothetical protein
MRSLLTRVATGVFNFDGHAFDNGFIHISFQCESYNSGTSCLLY